MMLTSDGRSKNIGIDIYKEELAAIEYLSTLLKILGSVSLAKLVGHIQISSSSTQAIIGTDTRLVRKFLRCHPDKYRIKEETFLLYGFQCTPDVDVHRETVSLVEATELNSEFVEISCFSSTDNDNVAAAVKHIPSIKPTEVSSPNPSPQATYYVNNETVYEDLVSSHCDHKVHHVNNHSHQLHMPKEYLNVDRNATLLSPNIIFEASMAVGDLKVLNKMAVITSIHPESGRAILYNGDEVYFNLKDVISDAPFLTLDEVCSIGDTIRADLVESKSDQFCKWKATNVQLIVDDCTCYPAIKSAEIYNVARDLHTLSSPPNEKADILVDKHDLAFGIVETDLELLLDILSDVGPMPIEELLIYIIELSDDMHIPFSSTESALEVIKKDGRFLICDTDGNIHIMELVEASALWFLMDIIKSNGPVMLESVYDHQHLTTTEVKQLFGKKQNTSSFTKNALRKFCKHHQDHLAIKDSKIHLIGNEKENTSSTCRHQQNLYETESALNNDDSHSSLPIDDVTQHFECENKSSVPSYMEKMASINLCDLSVGNHVAEGETSELQTTGVTAEIIRIFPNSGSAILANGDSVYFHKTAIVDLHLEPSSTKLSSFCSVGDKILVDLGVPESGKACKWFATKLSLLPHTVADKQSSEWESINNTPTDKLLIQSYNIDHTKLLSNSSKLSSPDQGLIENMEILLFILSDVGPLTIEKLFNHLTSTLSNNLCAELNSRTKILEEIKKDGRFFVCDLNSTIHVTEAVEDKTLQFLTDVVRLNGPIPWSSVYNYHHLATPEVRQLLGKKPNNNSFTSTALRRFCGIHKKLVIHAGILHLMDSTNTLTSSPVNLSVKDSLNPKLSATLQYENKHSTLENVPDSLSHSQIYIPTCTVTHNLYSPQQLDLQSCQSLQKSDNLHTLIFERTSYLESKNEESLSDFMLQFSKDFGPSTGDEKGITDERCNTVASDTSAVENNTSITTTFKREEQEGIEALIQALTRRGPIPVHNLIGCILNCSSEVRKAVGNTDALLKDFLKDHSDYFVVEGDQDTVHIRKNHKTFLSCEPNILNLSEQCISQGVSQIANITCNSDLERNLTLCSEFSQGMTSRVNDLKSSDAMLMPDTIEMNQVTTCSTSTSPVPKDSHLSQNIVPSLSMTFADESPICSNTGLHSEAFLMQVDRSNSPSNVHLSFVPASMTTGIVVRISAKTVKIILCNLKVAFVNASDCCNVLVCRNGSNLKRGSVVDVKANNDLLILQTLEEISETETHWKVSSDWKPELISVQCAVVVAIQDDSVYVKTLDDSVLLCRSCDFECDFLRGCQNLGWHFIIGDVLLLKHDLISNRATVMSNVSDVESTTSGEARLVDPYAANMQPTTEVEKSCCDASHIALGRGLVCALLPDFVIIATANNEIVGFSERRPAALSLGDVVTFSAVAVEGFTTRWRVEELDSGAETERRTVSTNTTYSNSEQTLNDERQKFCVPQSRQSIECQTISSGAILASRCYAND